MNEDPARDVVAAALRGVLERDNSLSRCCAVRALGRLQVDDRETLECLIALLHDPDPDVRLDVAVMLGGSGQNKAVPDLVESLLNDPEGEVRIEAARALAKLGAPQAVEPLIRCLREDGLPQLDLSIDDMEFGDSLEVQSQALNALGDIGDPRATTPVVEILSDPDYEDLQETGFEVLSKLDDSRARAFLLEQLAGGSKPLARRRAAHALGALAHSDSKSEGPGAVVLALINALLDVDPTVRISAGQALAEVKHPVVTVPLTLLLTDLDSQVKVAAADILVRTHAPGVVERLLEMLSDAGLELKVEITRLLGDSGDPKTVPVLRNLLTTEDERLRYQVVTALGALGRPGVERDLATILQDPKIHANTRARAAAALGRIAGVTQLEADGCDADTVLEHEKVLEALECAVFDRNQAVALAALTGLVELMTPEKAVQLLSDLLRRVKVDVQPENPALTEPEDDATDSVESKSEGTVAADPLRELVGGHTAQSSTLAAILSASDDADPPSPHPEVGAGKPVPAPVGSVQVLAAGLLGEYPDAGSISVPVLVEALKGASERLTREVLLALGRIGDIAAIEPVLRCLESDEEQVRLAAIDALVGIGKGLESPVLNAALVRLLDDPGATVRDWAVRALADAGGEMAGLHLPRMLADEDRSVCRRAMAGLTPAMGGPQLSRQLQANLFRFSAGLRHEAAATLRRLNDSDSTTWLLDLLREDEQEAFHWICIDALGEIHATPVGAAAG